MNTQELVDTLLATREFCGSEREALKEWESENGKLEPYALQAVLNAVEREWQQAQRAAGVTKPISHGERRKINRDLA